MASMVGIIEEVAAAGARDKLGGMPMFYVALSNMHTGQFVAVITNRTDEQEAAEAAGKLYEESGLDVFCLEAATLPVPVDAPIPAGFLGRLLSLDELGQLDEGVFVYFSSDGSEVVS